MKIERWMFDFHGDRFPVTSAPSGAGGGLDEAREGAGSGGTERGIGGTARWRRGGSRGLLVDFTPRSCLRGHGVLGTRASRPHRTDGGLAVPFAGGTQAFPGRAVPRTPHPWETPCPRAFARGAPGESPTAHMPRPGPVLAPALPHGLTSGASSGGPRAPGGGVGGGPAGGRGRQPETTTMGDSQ